MGAYFILMEQINRLLIVRDMEVPCTEYLVADAMHRLIGLN